MPVMREATVATLSPSSDQPIASVGKGWPPIARSMADHPAGGPGEDYQRGRRQPYPRRSRGGAGQALCRLTEPTGRDSLFEWWPLLIQNISDPIALLCADMGPSL